MIPKREHINFLRRGKSKAFLWHAQCGRPVSCGPGWGHLAVHAGTALARHAIGLNWCAIGIENVGGARGKEDLTEAQLRANIALISYLKDKYPTLTTVLGHYEQDKAKQTDLWREDVPNYYHGKIDPGPTFMKGLREALTKKGLKFL